MTVTDQSDSQLLSRIQKLEEQLKEAEQLIEAIKAGEVDAFAINNNENESEIYTLQSGDYAYRVLIEEFEEGAINVTEEGLIVYTNPYFCELLKLPYEKVISASIYEFVHSDSKKEFNRLFKESFSGKRKGEVNLQVNDTIIPVYISLTSLRPKLATIGIIITDLTEKKKSEKLIQKYQRDLESKNVALLQSNSELASFAYIASHDLQEPLRKIQTFASHIIEREKTNLSESGKDHFERMQAAARRMQTLIEDLLTYSRTNTAERKFEKMDLGKILDNVKQDLKEELQQKNAFIESTEMCDANIIPFQFRQLFYNLISNSLKFSNPQRPPRITIKSETATGNTFKNEKLARGKKYCHLSISDNGIGFEQQYSEKVFELFQRLHANSQYSGSGLGLAIVKKIVENHNGFISVQGEPDKGATFDIYIPAAV